MFFNRKQLERSVKVRSVKMASALLMLAMVLGSQPERAWSQSGAAKQVAAVDQQITGQQQIAGYRGIWFTLGQFYGPGADGQPYGERSSQPVFPYGDKYSGGLGTYTAKHHPLAVYVPQVDRTYFVYGGTPQPDQRHLLCMISYFDHRTGTVPRPVVVYDKVGVDDPHDNPTLQVDQEGYLWVFVSGRSRSRLGLKYRSSKPFEIDRFEQVQAAEFTYPQPHRIFGVDRKAMADPAKDTKIAWQGRLLFLFTKYSGMRELYFESSVDGRWTPTQKLAGIKRQGDARAGHYQTSDSALLETAAGPLTKVGTFFNRHPNGDVDKRTDLYYLETLDGGQSWQSVDGEPISLPVTQVESQCRVIDWSSQGQNVYLKNMALDASGRPVVLYVTSRGAEPGPPNGPRLLRVTRWDGEHWQTSDVGEVDHNYDTGSLTIGAEQWSVLAPAAPGPQPDHGGGEVMRFVSQDEGKTWQLSNAVTKNSPRNHNYVRKPIAAKDPFFAFWADGDPTTLSISKLYFCDSTGEHVYELPYEMDQAVATPVKVQR